MSCLEIAVVCHDFKTCCLLLFFSHDFWLEGSF